MVNYVMNYQLSRVGRRGRRAAGRLAAALLAAGTPAACSSSAASRAAATLPAGAASTIAIEPITSATGPPSAAAVATTAATSVTTTPVTAVTTVTTPGATTIVTTTSTTTTAATTMPVGIDLCPPNGRSIWEQRDPSDLAPPVPPAGWTAETIGTSVQGRPIELLARRVDEPRRRVVVIGGIHGNEPVSPPTVRGLVLADIADDIELYLVPELNPDGVAAGVRCNANGVDLNRNFPWGWRADDGGPAALSEPETSAIAALIDAVRPDVAVWVHQPYGYVSSIGPTADAFEEAWAAGSATPVRPDVTQHGGGESWTALGAGHPSMLIEIDTWEHSADIVAAHRAGFEALVAALG